MESSNILLAAVAKYSSSRFDRDLLTPGDYPARFRITGHVGDEKITDVVNGTLNVAENQTRSTSKKPDLSAVIAALLMQLPKRNRQKVCDRLLKKIDSDAECETLAKHLFKDLTATSTAEIRGTVSFAAD